MMTDRKRLETVVVLALACLAIAAIRQDYVWACVSAGVLSLGLFRKPSTWLATGWLALAHVIGLVVGTVLLSLIFYFVLTPLAFFTRLAGRKAAPFGHRPEQSAWVQRNHRFLPTDFDRPF
jgi:hypothetical protein